MRMMDGIRTFILRFAADVRGTRVAPTGMMDGMPPPLGGYRPELGQPPPGVIPPPPELSRIYLMIIGVLLISVVLGLGLAFLSR